ncbi:hypothetical protein [Pasteuria penetrans]|nr:hypothetical protein [Pasteuria penetrans]
MASGEMASANRTMATANGSTKWAHSELVVTDGETGESDTTGAVPCHPRV